VRTFLLILALVQAGCGGYAVVERRDQTEIEGTIIGGTEEQVLVQPATGGAVVVVPRGDIDDIDHDGNVALITFAVVGLPFLPFIGPSGEMAITGRYSGKGGERQDWVGHFLGLTIFATSITPWVLATWSGIRWGGSRLRASGTDRRPPPSAPSLSVAPGGILIRF